MQKKIPYIMLVMLVGISTSYAYSQEVSLATFQETAQIIVDNSGSQNVTASITLQSSSIQEIMIPAELDQKIREDKRITAIVLTNQKQCVLGVVDEACIIINTKRDLADKGIVAIQDNTRLIGDSYIGDINKVFDIDAKFHSVFIHTDESDQMLNTGGMIAGRGTISAVYTFPLDDTSQMYEKVSTILIPEIIKDGGGFYEVARELSFDENAKISFSIIPVDSKSLLQLSLSIIYSDAAAEIGKISPLEFLKINELERSKYFSTGFYPLNSIIQVFVTSDETISISDVNGHMIPTQDVNGEKIPTQVSKQGWVFDPSEGKIIQGKYIFGKESKINKEDLKFSLTGENMQPKESSDESIIVVIIISVVAIIAALYYLKGYKK